MNFQRGHRRDEPEINFIPLIDLLLVILIFLMVTTTYARFSELKLNLPSVAAQPRDQQLALITVAVTREGKYAIEGDGNQTRDASGLVAAIRNAIKNRQDPVVAIYADAGSSHQSVVQVIEAARQAGITRVTFAAQNK